MATITFDEAMLILKRWYDESTSLFVATSEQPSEFRSRASVTELTAGGVLLTAPEGVGQFRVNFLSSLEISCWYFEPREFEGREECKEWVASLSDGEKLASTLGFSFAIRFVSKAGELNVPLGKTVFMEIVESSSKGVQRKSS